MKKFMRIIWKTILIHLRINTVTWAIIGIGTFLFDSHMAGGQCEMSDPEKGFDRTSKRAINGLRESWKFIRWIIKETVSYIADEIGSF